MIKTLDFPIDNIFLTFGGRMFGVYVERIYPISQMRTDVSNCCYHNPVLFSPHGTYLIRLITMFVLDTTCATLGEVSVYTSGAPEITHGFWVHVGNLQCSRLIGFQLFFVFCHDIVSLFSTCGFECPFGVFLPSKLSGSGKVSLV